MATIDVPDQRLQFIHEAFLSRAAAGSTLTLVDTAGLVDGSHQVRPVDARSGITIYDNGTMSVQGEGLGNGTLDYVAKTDVLFHIVRAFDNDTISHVRPLYPIFVHYIYISYDHTPPFDFGLWCPCSTTR